MEDRQRTAEESPDQILILGGQKIDLANLMQSFNKLQKEGGQFQNMNECTKGDTTQTDLDERTNRLIRIIHTEADRASKQSNVFQYGGSVETTVIDNVLWVAFIRGTERSAIQIPLPTIDANGLELMINKDVVRVLCDYWLERNQCRLNYHDVVAKLFFEDVNTIFPDLRSGDSMFVKILRSFGRGQLIYMSGSLQRMIDDIVNRMPLHETPMNSWAMNRRIMIIDPEFEHMSDPTAKLEYQVEKNKKYYERYGWTSIGLSDGVLADKNYMLTTDLRKFTPYGLHHNPQRNLYSTLGMKGDELPRVRSESMQALIDKGITRKGWNLMTVVLDVPMNFEDQILVDKRHLSLSHDVSRRFILYGHNLRVKEGDSVKLDDILGYSDDGAPLRMSLRCDEAIVKRIRKDSIMMNAAAVEVFVIVVEGKRFMRDGTKFSNLHGNKGVVRFMDLGYAVHPKTGQQIPIDVMVSARSINKRRNFGQILEALTNNLIPGTNPVIVSDNYTASKEKLSTALAAAGFPDDGVWMVDTCCGKGQAITGKMFWGVTKDAEDQMWDDARTGITNNRELRTSGLKFSHVEMKALVTRFGQGNAILQEIISHAQGVEILQDDMRILHSAHGRVDSKYPVIDSRHVASVNMKTGLFHTIDEIKGTVVDDEYFPEGFVMRLPIYFQVLIDKADLGKFTWGLPQEVINPSEKTEYMYNIIFIPNALMRRCWRHPSGKWGLNVLGSHVNSIVNACRMYSNTNRIDDANLLAKLVGRYFRHVASSMSTKRGELSVYGMAVRYPFSSRATAVLSDNLPKNTVEIHADMAKALEVKSGDILLAERFPCLGFMSIRPQFVQVTDDPQCRNVIRVSGNSLVSMNLDFDGDTLFLASFHSPAAIELLRKEMANPNQVCETIIESMNAHKIPVFREMSLDELELCAFPRPTTEEHAELVRKATGVKSHTGPVIALAYNLMRIAEANIPYSQTAEHAQIEVLLDFLGNTVFKQKHGIKSLQEEATDAICMADVDKMVALGFEYNPSKILCDLIKKESLSIGVKDLVWYHTQAKERGWSKIINKIVRMKNRVYFATRSSLGPFALLDHLQDKPRDLPSSMLFRIMRSPHERIGDQLDRIKADRIRIKNVLHSEKMREVYDELAKLVDRLTTKERIQEVYNGLQQEYFCGEGQG